MSTPPPAPATPLRPLPPPRGGLPFFLLAFLIAGALASLGFSALVVAQKPTPGGVGTSAATPSQEVPKPLPSSSDGLKTPAYGVGVSREDAGRFLQYYYTTAPKDPEITWRYLTPAKQAASPDYQSFWESVSTAKPKLEEWSDSVATVKLSLVLKSGKEATKTEKLTLRRERGQIKIDVGK